MADRREGTTGRDLFAVAVVMAGGVGIVVCTAVWLAAQLTVVLSGRGWADAPFSDSPRFVVRLVETLDVDEAWVAAFGAEEQVGPAWLFWLVLMALATGFVALAAYALLARWKRRDRAASPARWANRSHHAKIAVPLDPAKRPWRLVAGKTLVGRRLLAGDDCVSAVVFGPNGSGKTTGLIVPNVIEWDGPVVLTTAKPQDLAPVCAARAKRGPVWVVAPGGAPGHEVVGWSPVSYATDEESADRMAEWLVEASGMTGDPKAKPWNAQARKFLKGVLLAAHVSGGGTTQWVEWIYAGERAADTVEDLLRSTGYSAAAREYASTWLIHEEGKGSVLFTALGLADTYSRPGVAAAAAPDGFDPAAVLDASSTLCIVTPHGEGDRFTPYFTTLVSAVIHAAETRAATSGAAIKPRLLLALDEAGNVFRYPRLPHLLTTARGNGIQLLLVYHDLAQLEHLYGGRAVARTVVSNAKMRMLLPGVGDLETLRYWSELIGRTRAKSHGESWAADGRRSRSTSEHAEDLAPLHLLQQLPDGQAVLLYQNLPPARVRLRPWYSDKHLRQLVELPAEVAE